MQTKVPVGPKDFIQGKLRRVANASTFRLRFAVVAILQWGYMHLACWVVSQSGARQLRPCAVSGPGEGREWKVGAWYPVQFSGNFGASSIELKGLDMPQGCGLSDCDRRYNPLVDRKEAVVPCACASCNKHVKLMGRSMMIRGIYPPNSVGDSVSPRICFSPTLQTSLVTAS